MSIATGLGQWLGLPLPAPAELAVAMGRGKRSVIGTYGFAQGGLLVDRGKQANTPVAPLDCRIDFPTDWPIVLMMQRHFEGLSGPRETEAFDRLPPVPHATRQKMVALVREQMVPAVMQRNYPRFGESVYQFGRSSGLFFETIQGGAFANPQIAELIALTRESGVLAVGQSSWGPCVFAITRHDEDSQNLIAQVERRFGDAFELATTQADNRGVQVSTQ